MITALAYGLLVYSVFVFTSIFTIHIKNTRSAIFFKVIPFFGASWTMFTALKLLEVIK